ncbi:hypothetical protein PDUR_27520 [Paenibacillus durus]|uniref:Uncharacterized protein n=2 Tax=Paenibacillus durus TaxID=44251 RepID=A0A089HXT1_PAEDU|nr:hypothetical protein PDUR_27520 [Paenibacillus durus]
MRVVPLQKEIAAVDKELGTLDASWQLEQSSADPVPLHQVKQAIDSTKTQMNLLQTIVKQIHVKKGQKIEGIEFQFDAKVNAAPSTQTVAGAFALSRQKILGVMELLPIPSFPKGQDLSYKLFVHLRAPAPN